MEWSVSTCPYMRNPENSPWLSTLISMPSSLWGRNKECSQRALRCLLSYFLESKCNPFSNHLPHHRCHLSATNEDCQPRSQQNTGGTVKLGDEGLYPGLQYGFKKGTKDSRAAGGDQQRRETCTQLPSHPTFPISCQHLSMATQPRRTGAEKHPNAATQTSEGRAKDGPWEQARYCTSSTEFSLVITDTTPLMFCVCQF